MTAALVAAQLFATAAQLMAAHAQLIAAAQVLLQDLPTAPPQGQTCRRRRRRRRLGSSSNETCSFIATPEEFCIATPQEFDIATPLWRTVPQLFPDSPSFVSIFDAVLDESADADLISDLFPCLQIDFNEVSIISTAPGLDSVLDEFAALNMSALDEVSVADVDLSLDLFPYVASHHGLPASIPAKADERLSGAAPCGSLPVAAVGPASLPVAAVGPATLPVAAVGPALVAPGLDNVLDEFAALDISALGEESVADVSVYHDAKEDS